MSKINIKHYMLLILIFIIYTLIFSFVVIAQEKFQDIKIFKDMPYSGIKEETSYLNSLDIYVPEKNENCPVIVFVHGGTWVLGDKGKLSDKAVAFTRAGMIYISINYRLSSEVKHPLHAYDVTRAIVWIYKHISEFGGNPENIFLLGHSAGGHLAALITIDERYLGKLGFSSKIIKGVIGLDSAAYHLPTLIKSEPENYFLFEMAFGDNPEKWEEASPLNYIKKGKDIPPFLLIYAGDREVTKVVNLTFAQALQSSDYQVHLYYAFEKNHVNIEQDLGKAGDEVIKKIFQFIDQYKD